MKGFLTLDDKEVHGPKDKPQQDQKPHPELKGIQARRSKILPFRKRPEASQDKDERRIEPEQDESPASPGQYQGEQRAKEPDHDGALGAPDAA